MVTLMLTACGTVLIAFVPGYAAIGLAAPLLVSLGRLLQGFSAGVEPGGVSVCLSEMAARTVQPSSCLGLAPSSRSGPRLCGLA